MRPPSLKRALLALGLVFALTAGGTTASAAVEADERSAQAAAKKKRCDKVAVAGKLRCVRRGERCKARLNRYYVRYGFSCKRKRLRQASLRQLRGSQVAIADSKSGVVSKRIALQAFMAVYGPLPGVKQIPGAVGEFSSGSGPVRWILRVRDQLTPEQREAVDARLAGSSQSRRVRANAAAYSQGEVQKMYDDAEMRIAQLKGQSIFINTVVQTGGAPDTVYTSARPILSAQGVLTCLVETSPKFHTETPRLDRDVALALIAGEAWTCFQIEHSFQTKDYIKSPAWVVDGQQAYVGLEVARQLNGGSLNIPAEVSPWRGYLDDGPYPLFKRTHSAIGFYAQVATLEEDLPSTFKRLLPMLNAPDEQKAFGTLVRKGDDFPLSANEFRASWAPNFARDPDLGELWDVTGPAIPPFVRKFTTFELENNEEIQGQVVPGYANDVIGVVINSDIVLVEPAFNAVVRIRFNNSGQEEVLDGSEVQKKQYCTNPKGCPPKCGNAHPKPEPANPGLAHVALGGGKNGGNLIIRGVECRKPNQGGGGGENRCHFSPTRGRSCRHDTPRNPDR